MKKNARIPVLLLAAVAAAALSGCSVMDELRNEASADFASTAALQKNWSKTAVWVPADAVDIRTRFSTTSNAAILRATTDAALDPAVCAEVDRQSGPVFDQEWSGDAYVDNAWACGEWTVVATDDGWYGWTPNHPVEAEQSPGFSGTASTPSE